MNQDKVSRFGFSIITVYNKSRNFRTARVFKWNSLLKLGSHHNCIRCGEHSYLVNYCLSVRLPLHLQRKRHDCIDVEESQISNDTNNDDLDQLIWTPRSEFIFTFRRRPTRKSLIHFRRGTGIPSFPGFNKVCYAAL